MSTRVTEKGHKNWSCGWIKVKKPLTIANQQARGREINVFNVLYYAAGKFGGS